MIISRDDPIHFHPMDASDRGQERFGPEEPIIEETRLQRRNILLGPDEFRGGRGTAWDPFIFAVPYAGDVICGFEEAREGFYCYHLVRSGIPMKLETTSVSRNHSMYFPILAVRRNDFNTNVYLEVYELADQSGSYGRFESPPVGIPLSNPHSSLQILELGSSIAPLENLEIRSPQRRDRFRCAALQKKILEELSHTCDALSTSHGDDPPNIGRMCFRAGTYGFGTTKLHTCVRVCNS